MSSEDQQKFIQDLVLLQRVAQMINSNLDIDSLLEEIVNDVSQTFGCSRLAVLLKDNLANELIVGADCGGDFNRHIKGERIKIGEYGMTGHVGATGETYYAPDVSVDPYYEVSDSQTRSEVDIPLRSHGQLIGVLNAQHKELNGFSSNRIQVLEALAGHIATAIENAKLFQRERKEKERMSKELVEARNIQRGLFPDKPPDITGFKIDGKCLPCLEVGGDWYDYITLPDGRLGIVLADVSGKGLGAAMLMSSTRTVLRLVAEEGHSPAKVLNRVNHLLLKDFPTARFVTMIYGILDPKDASIVFASAGHCYPLLSDSSGTRFLKTDTGMPLGIQESDFSEQTIGIGAHSRLVLYSDGITEAMNLSSEQYGEARLVNHIADRSSSIDSLLNDVQIFNGSSPASDDTTVVMIESSRDNADIF
ncbi:MAG TPA: GAF domain-containing SpoIIE family protein phosphatase [Candidatus Acidoferrales bacterium]|nr:GAF domain-containing SpoIIE family protein phosphatase [Candidatus Acidoferrales bacterium]